MAYFGGLAAAAAAIVCGEILNRGRVLYSRPMPVLLFFAAFVQGFAALGFGGRNGTASAAALTHLVLSGLIALGAWFGLSVHLSNSISLRMLDLIDRGGDTRERLETAYDRKGRVERRIEVLARASYLTGTADPKPTRRFKTRWLLRALKLLRPKA